MDRASKEKGRKKKKISCLAKNDMLLKRDDFQLFFEKNSLIITNFLENVSTPEG